MRDGAQQERFAAKMRRHMTRAERHLWRHLRGFRCYPQRVLCGYIVDFAFPKGRLAVEVDGSSHNGKESYDSERDAVLALAGWRVIRFSNTSVLTEVEAVVGAIRKALALPPLRRIKADAEKPRPRIGDAVQFGCAVRKWKRLHPPVPAVGRLVKR